MFSISKRIDHTNDMDEDDGVWRSEDLPCPKSVKISLDDRCQFKCDFCVNSTQVDKVQMEWGDFTKLIDELAENGCEEIGLFFIGEPMLAKRLEDAIRYVKGRGIGYVFLTTNGALATVEKVELLMKAGLDSIKYSFNYANAEQMNEVTHAGGKNFQKLVDNIREVRVMRDSGRYKCGIFASSIRFTGVQQQMMEMAVGLIKESVDEHYWLPQYSFGAQTVFGEQVLGNTGRLDNQRETLPCWTIFKEGHVTAGGSVALCCFDVHEKWSAGNLKDMSFMEAWNSDKAKSLRKAHLAKDVRGTACEDCAHGRV